MSPMASAKEWREDWASSKIWRSFFPRCVGCTARSGHPARSWYEESAAWTGHSDRYHLIHHCVLLRNDPVWRSDSRRLPPTGSCEYGVIQPRIFWCKIDADSHESHKTDDQPCQRIDITLNGLRYGGTGFSYKKHANYAAVLIADRTIIGKISLSIDQSVDIK